MTSSLQKYYIRIFLGTAFLLCIVGLIFIYSASSVFALERFGSAFYFLKKQLVGLCIGILGIISIQYISGATIKNASPILFIGSLAATLLTLIPPFGIRIHGSSRWIAIPGLTLQPSELLKIFFILYFAYVLCKKRYKYSFLFGFIPTVLIIVLPALILLKQPDFGLTVTIAITALFMLFFANFQLWHIGITIASLIPVGAVLIFIKPYRMKRIMTFLNPWSDPKGSGFQIIQSLIAIGSGGLTGVGLAQSKQKFFYLPMQHTDFIFSIIAEETGFIGILLLISLYISFLYSAIQLAMQLHDQFSRLVILGFATIVNLQAVINIAVAAGLVPTKGIGLPFVSYGNTALVCNLWMIGIIMVLVRDAEKLSNNF